MNKRFTMNFLAVLLIFCAACSPSKQSVTVDNDKNTYTFKNGQKIVFTDLESAKTAIAKDDVEGFFDDVTILDMEIQMSKKLNASRTETLAAYRKHLQNDVSEFSDKERAYVTKAFQTAYEHIESIAPDIFPKEIKLVKMNMNHYGNGVFYTRENCIMIPTSNLMQEDERDFMITMIHEIFHIYSRYNTEKRDALYKRIGFEKLASVPAAPELLAKRILLNPDGVDYNYGITLTDRSSGNQVLTMPILYSSRLNYTPNVKGFFNYFKFKMFVVEDGKIKTTETGESTFKISQATDYFKQIENNTQYIIHPDEIMADNFALLVLSKMDDSILEDNYNIKPDGSGMQLIKDVEQILKQ